MDPSVLATPFYLDWKFWSFVVAAIALVLSQLPPIHILLRRARLTAEAHTYVGITHKVGNPNFQMHLTISNAGRKRIKISRISLKFQRPGKDFTLPAMNYLAEMKDPNPILFTPFKLNPDEDWTHIVNFLNFFSKEEEREYGRIRLALRNDIARKRANLEDKDQTVPADENNVAAVTQFFDKRFVWEPGEYQLTLSVQSDPKKYAIERKYRLTLFESDTQQLRDLAKGYAYGAGIVFDSSEQQSVFTTLTDENR